MTDQKDTARDLVVIAELAKRVRAADVALRTEYAAQAEPGNRTPWRVDGQPVGTVAVTEGAVRARVADSDALLRWVRANHPEEIREVPEIRAAYLAKLLDDAKAAGEPIDTTTGESVPGLLVDVGDPQVRVTAVKGSGAVIAAEWAAGRLAIPASVLPSIEAPEGAS